MEEFLQFGRFKRECVKIQGGYGLPVPLADAHAQMALQTIRWILKFLTRNSNPRKAEESNLRDYYDILDAEVLELNGFYRFALDGLVFLLNCHCWRWKNFLLGLQDF